MAVVPHLAILLRLLRSSSGPGGGLFRGCCTWRWCRGASTHGRLPVDRQQPGGQHAQRLWPAMRDRFRQRSRPITPHWYPTATITPWSRRASRSTGCLNSRAPASTCAVTPPWTVATMLREIRACLSPGAELSLPNVTESTSRMAVDADYREISEQVLGSPLQEMPQPWSQRCALFLGARIPAIISRPVVGNCTLDGGSTSAFRCCSTTACVRNGGYVTVRQLATGDARLRMVPRIDCSTTASFAMAASGRLGLPPPTRAAQGPRCGTCSASPAPVAVRAGLLHR